MKILSIFMIVVSINAFGEEMIIPIPPEKSTIKGNTFRAACHSARGLVKDYDGKLICLCEIPPGKTTGKIFNPFNLECTDGILSKRKKIESLPSDVPLSQPKKESPRREHPDEGGRAEG